VLRGDARAKFKTSEPRPPHHDRELHISHLVSAARVAGRYLVYKVLLETYGMIFHGVIKLTKSGTCRGQEHSRLGTLSWVQMNEKRVTYKEAVSLRHVQHR